MVKSKYLNIEYRKVTKELVDGIHDAGIGVQVWTPDAKKHLRKMIEIGVDILNPIQPAAKDMQPEKLKESFGDRITFHGGIDVQHLLIEKKPQEIVDEVNRVIGILSENGGYIIAPSHNIQANTPIENIIAFYDTVNEYQEK